VLARPLKWAVDSSGKFLNVAKKPFTRTNSATSSVHPYRWPDGKRI
jgi:hypothetical protein